MKGYSEFLPGLLCCLLLSFSAKAQRNTTDMPRQFLVVLGIAQDGGFPQAGCEKPPCKSFWDGRVEKRHVVSLGLVDNQEGKVWMFDATPDFPHQHHQLLKTSGATTLSGIFLTHAHIGHYTGLMHLGREVMDTHHVPVYAMPRMKNFLEHNGPWSQLVALNNISLIQQRADSVISLSSHLTVTPMLVPHRDELSETVGYRIESPAAKVLFIPDINKWHLWSRSIRDEIANVQYALLDGTFFNQDELPTRDMREIPHPYVVESMNLFDQLPEAERAKIIFIHFNHSNPLMLDSPERSLVEQKGYRVASEGQIISLE